MCGAKSILDLGLTLEYLETKGVPVVGYQTEELPAFYTRESGFKSIIEWTVLEIAKALKAKEELNMKGGMVIANPIPHEGFAMDSKVISKAIDDAVEEANKLGIKGKDTTPFLLDKVQKITEGKSLEANIQLVYNNAKLAAQIASELCKLLKKREISISDTLFSLGNVFASFSYT